MSWEEYEKKLTELGYKEAAVEKIKPVFLFAGKTHEHEKRESGEPYFIHPIAVSLSIAHLKLDADTISAALLHDVVENQGVKIETIKKQFGPEVAFLVEGVTKVDKVRYRGVERAIESLRKMFLALAEDIRVVIIKLMDRKHNMETLGPLPPDKQKRIALETLELYAPLADRLGMWEIKAKLEDLAFPYIYPDEYKWLQDQIKERKAVGEEYLKTLKPIIEDALKKEGIEKMRIVYRAKNLLSIWRKLLRNEMNFDRIMDLIAMRIIVDSVEECYKALGILHKVWKPVPGHIKDFIALPKPNGYQSLHTYVFGPGKKIVSFHIRTEAMNEEAEHGIAAHWFYEAGGKKAITKKMDEQKFAWVRQLQEWQKEHADGGSAETLSALKIDFFKNRIFVFTPKGDVIDLPEGATPIDFAYHVHSEIGNKMSGAKINNKMVQFSHKLASGDTVEILTQKNKKPTKDWLEFAKTSLAKGHIRSFLRKEGILEVPAKKKEKFEAVMTVKDRLGLLRDITTVFSNLNINIVGTKSGALTREHHRITIGFLPNKKISHTKILTSLKQIKNVESVAIKEIK
ncbi:MAG: RelA/SpoT family protein [bacterium]|nr:RelA/SpoT family protein [bacterium]